MSEEVARNHLSIDAPTIVVFAVVAIAIGGIFGYVRTSGAEAYNADIERSVQLTTNYTPTPESNNQINEARVVGGPQDLFIQDVFGYSVLCGMLNTDLYGNTVIPGKPIFDSAEQIFSAMGDRVDHQEKVLVMKGSELTFRDGETGSEYSFDADGTMYCHGQ